MTIASRPRLHVIIVSTRPGRVGPKVADWFVKQAIAHEGFDTHLVDLAEFNLPVYDEPNLPKQQQYVHEHTKRWSESVSAADALVFVTPEYNASASPALFNALQFLFNEWAYKPVSFVSYAFGSGGVRGVQEVKTLLTTLKMMPIPEQVMVTNFPTFIGEDGVFKGTDMHATSAKFTLDELLRWTNALKPLRQNA